jgi:hypothetical protein
MHNLALCCQEFTEVAENILPWFECVTESYEAMNSSGMLKNSRHMVYCCHSHSNQMLRLIPDIDFLSKLCPLNGLTGRSLQMWDQLIIVAKKPICFILSIDLDSESPKLPYCTGKMNRSYIIHKPHSSAMLNLMVAKLLKCTESWNFLLYSWYLIEVFCCIDAS